MFFALLLPWALFAWRYFGALLPNTMLAKGVVRPGREHEFFHAGHARHLMYWYVSGTGFARDHPLLGPWLILLAFGVYAVARARRRELFLLPAFPLLYVGVMCAGRAPMYPWYLLPMLFLCLFVGGLGIGHIISWLAGRRSWPWRAVSALGILVALLGAGRLASDLPSGIADLHRYMENEYGLRRALGVWLKENTPARASVAMEAIGFQGYYSERRVIDQAGLVTPRVGGLQSEHGRKRPGVRPDVEGVSAGLHRAPLLRGG